MNTSDASEGCAVRSDSAGDAEAVADKRLESHKAEGLQGADIN